MRDGVNVARLGLPVVALVTEEFWPQGDFVSRSVGMPDIPRLRLPHPVAGTGQQNLAGIADSIADKLIERLGQ